MLATESWTWLFWFALPLLKHLPLLSLLPGMPMPEGKPDLTHLVQGPSWAELQRSSLSALSIGLWQH